MCLIANILWFFGVSKRYYALYMFEGSKSNYIFAKKNELEANLLLPTPPAKGILGFLQNEMGYFRHKLAYNK